MKRKLYKGTHHQTPRVENFQTQILVSASGLVETSVPRVLSKLVHVNRGQLGAAKSVGGFEHGNRNGIGEAHSSGLYAKAEGVVTLKEGLCVVYTASQVLDIDTGEGVDLAGVTTDIEELGVLKRGLGKVELEEGDGVRVGLVASVPVVGNLLVTGLRECQCLPIFQQWVKMELTV